MTPTRARRPLRGAIPVLLAALLAACGGGGGGGGGTGATAAPYALSSSANGNQIHLSWVNAATDATGIEVERASSPAGPFLLVAGLPPFEFGYVDADPALVGGETYWHRVRAAGPNGPSAWTDPVATTLPAPPPPPTGPSAPVGLSAIASGATAVSLAWTNTAVDATAVEVWRSESAGGPFALVATLGPSADSHLDTGLSPSTTYYYSVIATNAYGSGQSAAVSVTTGVAPPAPPPPPTGLAAVATGPSSVSLTWASGGGTVSGYEVERATASGGPFVLAGTPPAAATGFGDSGLSTGTTYWYRVRAVNAGGASGWAGPVSATPAAAAPTIPAAPSGLAVAPASATSLSLSWTDNASNETGFEVERAGAAGGPFVQIVTVGANVTAHTDSGLASSTAYWYRVRAVNGAGASAWSATVSATTQAPPAPAPPTGLTGVQDIVGTSAIVRLAWTDAATNETGYELQRSMDGAAWGATTALPANTASYVDSAPLFGTNWYRLRAVNGGGASAWVQVSVYNGPIVITNICFPPNAPAAAAISDTAIQISWSWANCGIIGVERALSAAGPWAEVARVPWMIALPPARNDIWNDTGLAPGTTYHYRLRSLPSFAEPGFTPSGYTSTVQATTPVNLPAPTGLTATVTSSTTATLRWTDTATGETGFAVEYATAAAGPFTEAFVAPANATQTGVAQLTPATAYWFRIRTAQGTTRSAPSNVAAFTTATNVAIRTNGDASVLASTATSSHQNLNFSNGPNSVGCFFTWTLDLIGQVYLWHNCAGSALRFDTSALAGRTILSAALAMYPCGLAPGPVNDATYVVRALASSWNPATVTFNTLPQLYTAGAVGLAAPTQGGVQAWDVTAIVRNWANGTWASNGLFVEQSPVVDHVPPGGVDWHDQTTPYCSLEQTGGSLSYAPTLWVDYQ